MSTSTLPRFLLSSFILLSLFFLPLRAQEEKSLDSITKQIDKKFEALDHRLDELAKAVDDVQWYNKVGDVASIDKVFIVGPPSVKVKDSTARGAWNPVKF
jgi:hypothetical protein